MLQGILGGKPVIGGWLGDRDFGACGGTILGKNAPAKEAPPLSLMLPPPQPSFQVCSSKTAEGSSEGSQVSACKAVCFLPPGPGWISDPLTTTVFGLFFPFPVSCFSSFGIGWRMVLLGSTSLEMKKHR